MHYQAKDGESKRVYQPSIVILIKNQILQTGVKENVKQIERRITRRCFMSKRRGSVDVFISQTSPSRSQIV